MEELWKMGKIQDETMNKVNLFIEKEHLLSALMET